MAPTRHYGDGAVDNMVGCIANSLSNSTPRQALEVAISFLFLFFLHVTMYLMVEVLQHIRMACRQNLYIL